jgi:hypothetical protein
LSAHEKMRQTTVLFTIFCLNISCHKSGTASSDPCDTNQATVRTIVDRPATVMVGATIYGAYYVEESMIDNLLVPCMVPVEFMQNGLKVTISGDIKKRKSNAAEPCCVEHIVITKIARR